MGQSHCAGLDWVLDLDPNETYRVYEPLDPSPQVQDLLDYLDDRADPIFWG